MANASDAAFMLQRSFDAPRDLVFRAFIEPVRLVRWFGPVGTLLRVIRHQLEPGGVFHYGMKLPDGSEMYATWTFREVELPRRLVFVLSFADAHGAPVRAPMAAGWPMHMLNTLTFEEDGSRTRLLLHSLPIDATDDETRTFAEGHASMTQGWGGTFAQLDSYLGHQVQDASTLPTDREIVITRLFDAPRERVFAAWLRPEHVARWFGPNGYTTTTISMDVRPGGSWRYTMRGPDGTVYPNRIDYDVVDPPSRLVYRHGDDGETGEVHFHVTVDFVSRGEQTWLEMRSMFPTAEARDRVVRDFGAIEGGQQTLARLADFVKTPA